MSGYKFFTAQESEIVEVIRGIIEQIAEREKSGQDAAQLYRQLEKTLTKYEDIRQNS